LSNQGITWSISNAPSGTQISQSGKLTVGDIEQSKSIVVSAAYALPDGQRLEGVMDVALLAEGTLSRKLELLPGWNLVAPTFYLDEASQEKLRSFNASCYDSATKCYVKDVDFTPGSPFWIFCTEKLQFTMTGTAR
jgi:hypothetical protein